MCPERRIARSTRPRTFARYLPGADLGLPFHSVEAAGFEGQPPGEFEGVGLEEEGLIAHGEGVRGKWTAFGRPAPVA